MVLLWWTEWAKRPTRKPALGFEEKTQPPARGTIMVNRGRLSSSHLGPWWCLGFGCRGPSLGSWLCCSHGLCRCLRLLIPPKAEKIWLYRVGLYLHCSATWGRTGPAPPRLRHSGERTTTPYLGSTAELTLIRGGCGGVQVNQPWEQEHGRSGPTPQLPYGSMGRGEMTPLPQCLRQMGELPLPLTSCSIWESRP